MNEIINKDEYVIVVVGVTDKQLKELPSDIIAITRTENVYELVEIYSATYVYFNPTYEDNFPTTNLEALACGTPVITYNTGGSPEFIDDSKCVIEKGNIESVRNILRGTKFQITKSDSISNIYMIRSYLDLYAKCVKNE